jgi:hypothetical protein
VVVDASGSGSGEELLEAAAVVAPDSGGGESGLSE